MTNAKKTRTERDSFGEIEVPADQHWGAQTARSLHFFAIGDDRMPLEVIHALATIKSAAASVNAELELLPADKAKLIVEAASVVTSGGADGEFPLSTWQTGSGTQSNMNVNEVIASIANERATGTRGGKSPIHPNDDVNLSQSSNDAFPSAVHIAATLAVTKSLLPSLEHLQSTIATKAEA